MRYVYEVAYTVDNEPGAGSRVYTTTVAAESKGEAFRKVRRSHRGFYGTGLTPHVARWVGRHEKERRGTISTNQIDIE